MSQAPTDGSLFEVFSEIPDPRHRRGTVYPLPAVLTLVATAMLCGCRSLAAIAQWGRDYNHLAPQLGLSRQSKDQADYRTPCTSELHTLMAALSAEVFEAALTRWILAQGETDLKRRVVALDGKTLRGSQGHQLPGVHLLAAYTAATSRRSSPRSPSRARPTSTRRRWNCSSSSPSRGRWSPATRPSPSGTSARRWSRGEATISWPSRTNSRRWNRTSGPLSARLFPPREELRRATEDDQAEVHGKGHGRVETRGIRTATRLTGYLDWPGVKPVCLLERTRRIKGKTTVETVCAVTSLGPEQASAKQLLAIWRGHWGIEIPQSEDSRCDNLCVAGPPRYHRHGGPARAGRVVRPASVPRR